MHKQRFLRGGTFEGAGSHGCAFKKPLAAFTMSGEGFRPDPHMLGKVMSHPVALDELNAMRPFVLADPARAFGVYADLNLLRVNPRLAAESAGGYYELNRCSFTKPTSFAGLLMKVAAAAPSDAEAVALVDAKAKQLQARVDAAQKKVLEHVPLSEKWEVAQYALDLAQEELDETILYQLVSPFAENGDMKQVLERIQTTGSQVRDAIAQLRAFHNLTRGLAVYHAASLVHRDIKPANIVLVGAVYKFIDFGESLPLANAIVSKWQAAPYVYFPVLVRAKMGAIFDDALFTEQAVLASGHKWIPSWLKTNVGLRYTYAQAATNTRGSMEAVVLHTDVYQLALTLCYLYWSLTGATFVLDPSNLAAPPTAQRPIPFYSHDAFSADALAVLDTNLALLVCDATFAKLSANEFESRFNAITVLVTPSSFVSAVVAVTEHAKTKTPTPKAKLGSPESKRKSPLSKRKSPTTQRKSPLSKRKSPSPQRTLPKTVSKSKSRGRLASLGFEK
jgi:serine/threonine protein kinase